MKSPAILTLLKRTASKWSEDEAVSRAASLSYYTIFSLAPLLLIAVSIAGLVFGRDAVSGHLSRELRGLVGEGSAKAIQEMMAGASNLGAGVVASLIGLVVLVLGATGAFVELQDTLNVIWGVDKAKTSGLWGFIRARLLSFAMIGVIAFLLLVSLVVSAALAAVGHFAEARLPGGEAVFQVVNLLISFGVVTLLFAAIFKVLPNTRVAWHEVWLGAAVTSLLFVVGKSLIGLYIGKSSVASTYGAAGSFAALLIWINYSAMILFFGAEFTQVHARESRARQGAAPSAPRPDTATRPGHASRA